MGSNKLNRGGIRGTLLGTRDRQERVLQDNSCDKTPAQEFPSTYRALPKGRVQCTCENIEKSVFFSIDKIRKKVLLSWD